MFLQLCKKALRLVSILIVTVFWSGQALAVKHVTVISGIGKVNINRIDTIQPVFEGIREGLKSAGIVPEFQFVELGAVDESIKDAVGASALALTMSHKPDLIITLTDDALAYVGTKVNKLPVVFAWIFRKPYDLGLPKPNITGVIQDNLAAATWGLTKELTGAATVTMLSKDNEFMQGVKQYLEANKDKLQSASGVQLSYVQLVDRFSDWTEAVRNCRSKMIYLADTSRIDRNGHMKSEEVVRWTVTNATVPVIAATEKDVKAGALLAFVPDNKATGLRAADLALKILDGAKPSDIPYVTNSKTALMINRSTARRYGIVLPRQVMAWATKIFE